MDLVLKRENPKDVFMAALLSCTSKYKDSKIRVLTKEENPSVVNVTETEVRNLCPSWASSEIISRLIQHKVWDPIFEHNVYSIEDKVYFVRNALEKCAEKDGVEMPN